MPENRPLGTSTCQGGQRSDTICIDTNRVLDCCRDRDCFEDVRVYLDTYGQSIIDGNPTLRVTDAKIVRTSIAITEVPFNDGFYQLDLRYYVLLRMEACVGGKSQTFCGISAIDKKVVLWGGEGNVTIFKSNEDTDFCHSTPDMTTNLPIGVVETVPPIVLNTKVIDCDCQCSCQFGCCNVGTADFPEYVTGLLDEPVIDPEGGHRLFVSLGIFSVIRVERPAQYLITASDYSVPDKECVSANESDPCSLFRAMSFPVDEFTPAGLTIRDRATGGCTTTPRRGCGKG